MRFTPQWVAAVAGILLIAGTSSAQEPSPVDEIFTPPRPLLEDAEAAEVQSWFLIPQGERLKVYGWLDGGFIGNTDSPSSKFNGLYNAVDRSNEGMFNQAYLVMERLLPKDGSFGVGGRADLLYGEDFLLAQSAGWELSPAGRQRVNAGQEFYGIAMPQLYGQVGTEKLNVKLGHFYSPVGYEGVMSPYNFFYSHSYSYQFFGPFTHWGSLGNWKPTANLDVFGGLVNGWNALDRQNDAINVLAGFKYTGTNKNWWTSFAIVTGDEFTNVAGLPGVAAGQANRTRYSYILSVDLTDRLEYVFHHHLGAQQDGSPDGGTALWYGIDQYLYYTVNEQWKVGSRIEWVRDNDGTRIGLNRPSNPNNPPLEGDVFSFTFGANWSPLGGNLIIRPELRADWYNGDGRQPYYDGTKDYQFMLGLDAILRF